MATVQLSFTPLPAHVRTARLVATAVARRSHVEESLLDEVRLAVGEACSRAVEAHRLYCPAEPVRVELSDRAGRFEVVVTDTAPAGTAGAAGPEPGGTPAGTTGHGAAAAAPAAGGGSRAVAGAAAGPRAPSGEGLAGEVPAGAPPCGAEGGKTGAQPVPQGREGSDTAPAGGPAGSADSAALAPPEGGDPSGAPAADGGTQAEPGGSPAGGAEGPGAPEAAGLTVTAANGALPAGIGLAVIEGLADDVEIVTSGAGVSIRMSWPLQPVR